MATFDVTHKHMNQIIRELLKKAEVEQTGLSQEIGNSISTVANFHIRHSQDHLASMEAANEAILGVFEREGAHPEVTNEYQHKRKICDGEGHHRPRCVTVFWRQIWHLLQL